MTFFKKGEKAISAHAGRAILLVLATVFIFSATAFATPPAMYNVTIYDGENAVSVLTAETDAQKILENEGITVSEAYGDSVSFKNFTGEDGSAIVIRRGVKVTIVNYDGTIHTVYTSGTVSDALDQVGIKLTKDTALNFDCNELLVEGMVIEIYDVYDITIKVDGKEIKKSVSGVSVADALSAVGVTLGGDDYVEPSAETTLKDGLQIEVFRVTTKQRTEKQDINYETKTVSTSTLYKGEEKVITNGIKGSKSVVYEDHFVNGELVESELVSEKVLVEPTNKVVQVGTKKKAMPNGYSAKLPETTATAGSTTATTARLPIGTPMSELAVPSYVTIGSNGLPAKYKRVINAKATAYCSPGDKTSTGVAAKNGYVAVDPHEIPYGTEMYIVSADGRYVYGYCIAADTGGFIDTVDNTVDLHMNSEALCKQWGRRDIVIYFL